MMNTGGQQPNEGESGWGWRFAREVNARRIRRCCFLIFACWNFLIPATALSQNEETAEYPLKLAFLYNFTKFVEWPAAAYSGPGAPLSICIVGEDPFSPDLEGELRTRKVESHPVEVKKLKPTDILSACHMVFVPAAEKSQAVRIVSNLKGSNTLTVGESAGFASLGGIINLTVEENKLHFEVNTVAAERAGLKLSSKLLSMAKIVKE
jgi:hypothetical protein